MLSSFTHLQELRSRSFEKFRTFRTQKRLVVQYMVNQLLLTPVRIRTVWRLFLLRQRFFLAVRFLLVFCVKRTRTVESLLGASLKLLFYSYRSPKVCA